MFVRYNPNLIDNDNLYWKHRLYTKTTLLLHASTNPRYERLHLRVPRDNHLYLLGFVLRLRLAFFLHQYLDETKKRLEILIQSR